MAENAPNAETAGTDWHLRLFRKSLVKQAKLRELSSLLGPVAGETCLDLGGDNGVISYHLRRRGGAWSSADLSDKAVESIRGLVKDRVFKLDGPKLPFEDGYFDAVVIIDMLEHVKADNQLVAECHRVLKPNGRLVVNVPHLKRGAVLPPMRRMLGLTDADHGHVRPGYTESQLFALLKDGFDVQEARTYSRFFVESLDTLIRLAARRVSRGAAPDPKGTMLDAQDFQRMKKAFRTYSLLYPFFWLAAQLDLLLFFTRGYSLAVRAKRRRWLPRRSPVLADGRSIAEAALGGKIGSAAPF